MILEMQHVDYTYKSRKSKQILNDISIQFEAETFYAIIGESGSGKTTLLSLLAGLDMPGRGTILYCGQTIQLNNLNNHRKHHVSLVFQNYNLIDYLTVKENVMLGNAKSPDSFLQKVALSQDDWNRNVLQLSGGQQQRVAIARALASDARILLADEPTGNLDENTAYDIIQLLKKTAHELGKCVIVVTHSRQLAAQADQLLQIKNGTLSKSDTSITENNNLL